MICTYQSSSFNFHLIRSYGGRDSVVLLVSGVGDNVLEAAEELGYVGICTIHNTS